MDDPSDNFVQGSGPSTFIKLRSPNGTLKAKDVFTFLCVHVLYICNVGKIDESSQIMILNCDYDCGCSELKNFYVIGNCKKM